MNALLEHLPHYSRRNPNFFLYYHKQLWADIDILSIKKIINEYGSICKHLSQAELSSVRNSLDHMRDDLSFPSIDVMLKCANLIHEASTIASNLNYIPNPLWLKQYKLSRNGLIEYEFFDMYNNSKIFYGPSVYLNTFTPDCENPWLIAPFNITEFPSSNIIFRYKQTDAYDKYWGGFPHLITNKKAK